MWKIGHADTRGHIGGKDSAKRMTLPRSDEGPERTAFQTFLDDEFPAGAICALVSDRGRPTDATDPLVTGRLLCAAVDRGPDGRWWHELIIDPRRAVEDDVEPTTVWVGPLTRHTGGSGLWEAEVRPASGNRMLLRLNADPPRPWRPTPRMRRAVTEAHPEF